ncbi:OLC1v1027266C5 [Oldenlandia corymbosa var. corymbosa]|uniref:OLC1v1027266C5 n=1 Tax=Oldenlandia corymbosa var. corymbosa TaxID=529605 RepID=A0AAV1C9S8_OLDCO|nr:OLC1v1027266C5 [Oldenlandia corymbosa var. corymbosa]
MEMDEYIEEEEFDEQYDFVGASEVDWEYEFDAAQFFDFCCPETLREAQDAERWFSFAGNYPPSPLVKLRWGGGSNLQETKTTTSSLAGNTTSDGDMGSEDSPTKGREGVMETKTKAKLSSTLMKPTVSHLAKLKQARDILLSNQLCARFQKSPIGMDGKSLKQGLDNLATKRQKLELGYLRRGSRLKQQALLLHKLSRKDGNTSPNAGYPKLKVTIPKEPALETLQRAKSRRSRTNSEASERSESESSNRKIFKPHSPTVKSRQKLTAIQAFNFETTTRALQRSSASNLSRQNSDISSKSVPSEYKRSNLENALKMKRTERPVKTKSGFFSSKVHPTKENTGSEVKITDKTAIKVHIEISDSSVFTFDCSIQNSKFQLTFFPQESKEQKEKRLSPNPPIDLFKKLSISSEMGSDTVSQPDSLQLSQDSKENAPNTFHPDFWRCVGKMNQCGSVKAIPGIGNQSINR